MSTRISRSGEGAVGGGPGGNPIRAYMHLRNAEFAPLERARWEVPPRMHATPLRRGDVLVTSGDRRVRRLPENTPKRHTQQNGNASKGSPKHKALDDRTVDAQSCQITRALIKSLEHPSGKIWWVLFRLRRNGSRSVPPSASSLWSRFCRSGLCLVQLQSVSL
jgi:hypothetical protein